MRPSFQFYPGDWRGSKWVRFDCSIDLLPRKPACYAIYLDGELAYIGQTVDLSTRMSDHCIRLGYGGTFNTKWGSFRSVVIKARFGDRYGDWAMRELRLIARLQPRLNCVGSVRRRGAA